MTLIQIPAIRLAIVAAVAALIAACATAPAQVDLTPPAKRQLDAKTQLETGRKY
jgi:hypothetical protein